ncbi:Vacuolar inheritance and morphology protein [Recurvomyces mirabilis]|uniref:Vacuolar inheritance and morphology protein n=1 Tax=Recurvomyces mirabilis TaxID=574656 RepID=A0AAE0WHW8_9PEZI|nr:Vacuolar inheritance and morphology protein [Recurvomyces mirabilis]KAK5152484.1 Vacuolar inheritance and morphology protein [Recurvomyces mirabilis]
MSGNNPGFQSLSGQMETTEPVGGGQKSGSGGVAPTEGATVTGDNSGSKRSEVGQKQTSASSTPTTATAPPLRKQRSSNLQPTSASPSAGSSPHTSRNTSPQRKDSRPAPLTTPISTQPSAAAIQRALSAANVPQLQSTGSVTEAVSRLPRTAKSVGPGSGETTPQWPVSPRLKSPPPSAVSSRRGSAAPQKKAETAAPSISVQGPASQTATPPPRANSEESRKSEQQLQTPAKVPSRGPSGKSTLETVQENSSDSIAEPPAAIQAAADLKPLTKIAEEGPSSAKKDGPESEKHTQHGESGSESAGSKIDRQRGRRQSLTQAQKTGSRPSNPSKSSFTPLQSAKARQAEGKQNMTVETETVQSIPQSGLNAGDRAGSGRVDPSGSIRLKPSMETIRPKKERKRPSQKARSINQGTGTSSTLRSPLLSYRTSYESCGSTAVPSSSHSSGGEKSPDVTRKQSLAGPWQRAFSFSKASDIQTRSDKHLRKASSKADIFEQRVASAVEQENTSDSDETFVYESNPPEPQPRPRHHSRTPSVTSAHSTADQQRGGVRSFGEMMDEQRRVNGKRSMKFSNNPYNDLDSPDSRNGTVRSHHARHFGKFGRGGSQASMYDPDSPFTQASKLRTGHLNMRQSRPNSPRSPQSLQQRDLGQQRPSALFNGHKAEHSFDFDGEGADDERTPLVGTVRATRNRGHARNLSDSVRSIDEYYSIRSQRSWCGRLGGCVIGICVFLAVILSAVAFLIMSNRPLYEVQIRKIQNVLASEQEIMLDLLVEAINPNALSITVADMDLNVFAKSKYVGSNSDYLTSSVSRPTTARRKRPSRSSEDVQGSPAKAGNPNPWQDLTGHWHAPSSSSSSNGGGVDHGTDPDPDFEKDAQTMLLGRIFHFDQALAFEGSPIKRHQHFSVGELRLQRPGNKTEVGGTERWENVLKHPFELIVRGVLKYQLPVSMRVLGVSVTGSVVVHPEDGVDEGGAMRLEPIKHEDGWEWVDLGEGEDDEPLMMEIEA